jgi:Cu2+-exporting ATPase
VAGCNDRQILSAAAAVERLSEHPLAEAIVRHVREEGLVEAEPVVSDFFASAGKGVKAVVGDSLLLLGNAKWLQDNGVSIDSTLQLKVEALERDAMTCVYIASRGVHVGVIAIADQVRPGAKELVSELSRMGIAVTLLSGDRQPVAEAVARSLGPIEVIAEVLPHDKDLKIRQLQEGGQIIAMVGDGINDAPALIRADVGIALGSGTDVSVDSADLVLMHNDLGKVLQAIQLSRRTLRTIKQNIGLSFIYNILMVPLAMMARVSPLVAAVTMPISSLVVIANAARIRSLFK